MEAVILAGGTGTRLAPYTTVFPKPLMPIENRPILEIVIMQLRNYGVEKITLAVGYLAELIEAYFGDGSRFGVHIGYLREKTPLGTAGPLAFLPNQTESVLVLNGDILTTLNFRDLMAFHNEKKAIATIAVCQRHVDVDFGVVEVDSSSQVRGYTEKPRLNYNVSMGVNVLHPGALSLIVPGEKLDIPELMKRMIERSAKVVAYLTKDFWLDIGRKTDYELAIEVFRKTPERFLPDGFADSKSTI